MIFFVLRPLILHLTGSDLNSRSLSLRIHKDTVFDDIQTREEGKEKSAQSKTV